MLDKNSVIPLYYQLKELFKEKIRDGTWNEHSKVPSEKILMETYGVSRATVRKALDELLVEGLIYRKQGVGTFVSETKIAQNLIGELSFIQQAKKQGLIPSSKLIKASEITNLSKRIIEMFNVTSSETIYEIIRVRLINDTPLILETMCIPSKFAPDILEQNLEDIAVFEYLEKNCKIHFTHSTLEIEPIAIMEFESRYLDVKVGQPALSLERSIYSKSNLIVLQKRIMRGDRGKLTLTLNEQSSFNSSYPVGIEFNEFNK